MRIFVLLLLLMGCHKAKEVKKPPTLVEVTKPTIRNVELYNSYVGHVAPFNQVSVRAQVEGVLLGYFFEEGQEVKQGDLLFTIDQRPYEAQLAKAKGALAQSIANLRYAEDVVKRNSALAQKDYVSQIQYDEYLTNVLSYRAEIEQNEAEIETAKINISYCNIHAPITGVTGRLQLNIGNLIQNAEETPMILLNQIQPIYTYFSVPQKDLPKIMRLHREKPLIVNAYLGKSCFKGSLDLIDNQVNDQTGSIWLRGIYPNEEKLLWPGEFIDVKLITGEVENALLIPTQSITVGQKGKYVFIVNEENVVDIRYVKTGQRYGALTHVKEGLCLKDQVVTKGQINLGKGVKVQIKRDHQ